MALNGKPGRRHRPTYPIFQQKTGISLCENHTGNNIPLEFAASRKFLASQGLDGETIPTPGHSDDGLAFTGDLPPRFMVSADDPVTLSSWDKI